MVNCRCRHCQLAGGTAFSSNVMVLREAVSVTGEPKQYDSTAHTQSIATRTFCATCGTPLFASTFARLPGPTGRHRASAAGLGVAVSEEPRMRDGELAQKSTLSPLGRQASRTARGRSIMKMHPRPGRSRAVSVPP